MANIYGSGLYGADLYSSTVPIAGTLNYYTYYGYSIPRAARMNTDVDSNIHLVQASKGVVQGYDYLTYRGYAIPKAARLDTVAEANIEKITLPFNDLGTDAVIQKPAIDPYTPERELSDSGVELIISSAGIINAHDTDSDNQMLQPVWYVWTSDRDTSDSGVELVQYKLTEGWDTDSDQQLTQYLLNLWTPDKELSDSGVELVTYKLVEGWDTDSENQITQYLWNLYTPDKDLSDTGVENLITPPATSTQVIDTYYGYIISKSARGDDAYNTSIQFLTIIEAWDNDAEQQLNTAYIAAPNIAYGQFYNIDGDVSDPNIELTTLPHDLTPAEDNQKQWADYTPEKDVDTGVQYLAYGIGVVVAHDTDSDNQIQQLPWYQDGDVSDASVELILLPALAAWMYDTQDLPQQAQPIFDDIDGIATLIAPTPFTLDIEHQIPQLIWANDIVEDRGILFTFAPVIQLDNDSEQQYQLQQNVRYLDEADIFIQVTTGWNDYDQNIPLLVGYSVDILDKDATNYLIIPNAFDDIQERVWPDLVKDDPNDESHYALIPVMELDSDFDLQIPSPVWALDIIEERNLNPIISTQEIDNDSEHQLAQAIWYRDTQEEKEFTNYVIVPIAFDDNQDRIWDVYAKDQIDEQNRYPIVTLLTQIDLDSEQQIQHASWQLDVSTIDSQVEYITLYNDWSSDDNQKPQDQYQLDRDVDTNVSFIFIPFDWGTDSENQKAQAIWVNDQLDEQNKYPIIPTMELDNDAEYQRPQDGYNVDRHLSDEAVEYITLPTMCSEWDNSIQFTPQDIFDTVDESVSVIILPVQDLDVERQQPWAAQALDIQEQQALLILLPAVDVVNYYTYYGYAIPKAARAEEGSWTQYLVISLVDYTWDNDDQQLQQPQWGKDELADSGVEFITSYALIDIDQQLSQAIWIVDAIEDRNLYPIIPIQEIDNDSEQQKLQPDWYKDHLSDEGVELITLPPTVPYLYAWDNDTENQIPQAMWYRDKIEDIDFVNYIVIPATVQDDLQYKAWESKIFDQDESYAIQVLYSVLDLDVEQQFPSTVYTGLVNVDESVFLTFIQVIEEDNQQRVWLEVAKDSVDDYAIQVTTVPTFVESVDLQFVTPLFVVSDNVDERVNVIIPAFITVLDADEQQFARYVFTADTVDEITLLPAVYVFDNDTEQQFTNRIFTSDNVDEEVLLPRIPLLDQDAEQQKLWTDTFKDDLLDTGVEYITLPPLGEIEVTDADQQISWIPQFGQDDISDSSVEIILYPGGVISAWDLDSAQQIPQAKFMLDMDLMDAGVERITLPAPAWDTDSENQLSWMPYTPDKELLDSGVELISYVPGIIRDWDSDIGNQIPNPNWYIDYWEERDINQNVIPPTIIYVMIVYKVTAFALLDAYVNVIPQMALANLSTALNMAVTQVAAAPQMLIANITVTLRVICKSVTNLSLGY